VGVTIIKINKTLSSPTLLTFTFGPARALSSRISSGFCTKERATQSIDKVSANSKSLQGEAESCDVRDGGMSYAEWRIVCV
jgi:hypothetical protein